MYKKEVNTRTLQIFAVIYVDKQNGFKMLRKLKKYSNGSLQWKKEDKQ